MVDYDDVSFVAIAGPGGLIGLVILLIVLGLAVCNDSECSKMSCPSGGTPKLMHHECLCVEKAW